MRNNINYTTNSKVTNKFNRTQIEESECLHDTLSEIIEDHISVCYDYIDEIEDLISFIRDILFAMEDKLSEIE